MGFGFASEPLWLLILGWDLHLPKDMVEGAMLSRDDPGDAHDGPTDLDVTFDEESEESAPLSNDGPEEEPMPDPPTPLHRILPHTTHMSFASSCLLKLWCVLNF